MSKIIGNPVGTTLPKPDWSQTDPNKGDYIKNKPDLQTLVGDTPVSEQISTAIKDKADKATTLAGYGITDAAAKNHTHKADEFEIDTPLGELQGDTVEEVLMLADEVITSLKINKVDKISGKGLSTNDLTNALKSNYDAAYTHISKTDNPHSVTKSQVGLGNVTNDAQVKRTEMGVANGVATLDETGKVPTSQLPSYVDDVLEYDKQSSFPTEGETGKIYIAKDINKTYRWSGSTYVEISASLALGETSSTAYAGDKGKANAAAISDLQSKVGDTAVSTQISDAIANKADKSEIPDISTKMNKNHPTGTGSFSLNRKAGTTVGEYSVAEGFDTTASGEATHAEGFQTTASGNHSHAEGYGTTASGYYSHAEGFSTTASGGRSHAEGKGTTASEEASHAEGVDTVASGGGSHAEGWGTIASGWFSHVQGKNNIEDANDTYAHIVGNGESNDSRSNAHTLDWNGNAWFQGEVKIGGTGQDDTAAKTLATTEDVATAVSSKASADDLTALSTLVGDKSVATQIADAIASTTKVQFITWEADD